MRSRYGEILTDNSPLIREQFDIRDLFAIKNPKILTNPETIIMLTQELQDIALNRVRLLICGPEYTETHIQKKQNLNIEYMALKR